MIACLRRFSTAGLAALCDSICGWWPSAPRAARRTHDASAKAAGVSVIDPALALTGKALLETQEVASCLPAIPETGAITEQCNVTNLSPENGRGERTR
jgi:hypothetical protein